MHISPRGLEIIKEHERYHRMLANGDCAAYLCPAGVPTIGWGHTRGVRLGLTWTRSQAEAALASDMEEFEGYVRQYVTAPLDQNQFDALVSFVFNVGPGNFQKSGVLAACNRGDRAGASRAFAPWNKGRSGGRGPLVVMPGLVRRRAQEAALFATPAVAPEVILEPDMPQSVAPPSATEQHMEAHDILRDTSWSYWLNHINLRSLKAFALALLMFIKDHPGEVTLALVAIGVAVIVFERSRYDQRGKQINV